MQYKISERFFRAVNNELDIIRETSELHKAAMRVEHFERTQKMLSRALERRQNLYLEYETSPDKTDEVRLALSDRNIRAFAIAHDNASKNLEPVLDEFMCYPFVR